jgi:tetratricopeptide (TPR) repeat protein
MTRRHWWLAISLAALCSATGCSSMGSLWPSGWFGSSSTPQNNLAQHNARNTSPANPSRSGANAQLGAPAAAATGPFAAMSTSFKKWSGGDSKPAMPSQDDPLSLDNMPKQLSPELYVQIAHMHEAKGDFANAIKQYEQALKVAPNNTQVLVELGRAYDRNNDTPKAIAAYQQAIKIDARCALAHNDLGLCYARQNDLARARDSLGKAVSLAPTSKLYRNNLATVLVSSRQYNEAYEQLAAVHPPAIAQYNVGILANRRSDKTEAIKRFQQASSLDPNLAQARHMVDKLNSVASTATAQIPARQAAPPSIKQIQTDVADQARQHQQHWRDEVRQTQADWQQQAKMQVSQVKSQINQTQSQLADRVQSQVNTTAEQASQGANQLSEASQTAIREAEAKIRAAMQPQVAPVEPGYSSSWVPPQADDVTPIEEEDQADGETTFSISDDDESPILLPPTGQ